MSTMKIKRISADSPSSFTVDREYVVTGSNKGQWFIFDDKEIRLRAKDVWNDKGQIIAPIYQGARRLEGQKVTLCYDSCFPALPKYLDMFLEVEDEITTASN